MAIDYIITKNSVHIDMNLCSSIIWVNPNMSNQAIAAEWLWAPNITIRALAAS